MANQSINIGSVPNDGTGDNLRAGATKINQNFTEIYTALGDGTNLSVTETVQDAVGDAISAGIQNGITVTYNDTNNQINFDVTAGSVTRIDYPAPNLYSLAKADLGTGVKYILVKVWGAGGSGACAGAVPGTGLCAGGGGGGYNEKMFFLDELQNNFAITVGAGGARKTPGGFGNVAGDAGGTSTFTDGNITLEATGGGGGGTGITLGCKGGDGGRSGTFDIFGRGAYATVDAGNPFEKTSSPNQFYLGGFGGGNTSNASLLPGPDSTLYPALDSGQAGYSVYGGGGGGGTTFGGTNLAGGDGPGGNSIYGGGGGSGRGGTAAFPSLGGVSNFAGNGGSSTGISVPTDPTIQDGQFPAGGGAACQRSAAGNFSGAGANGRVTIYVFK
jgi:hypothetical protein